MGFNSTIVVLNDRLAEIEGDPTFGKQVCDGIRNCEDNSDETQICEGNVDILLSLHKKLSGQHNLLL